MKTHILKYKFGLITLWVCLASLSINCLADDGHTVDVTAIVSSLEHLNQIQTLIQQAETYRANGHLTEAAKHYRQVRILAEDSNLDSYATLATGLTGYVLFLQQDTVQAEALLTQALQQSIKSNWTLQAAIHANHLGNYYAAKGDREKTQVFYREASLLAEKNKDFALVARIRINQARLANIDDPEHAWIMLQELEQSLNTLEPTQEKTALLLATSYQVLELKPYPTIDQNQRTQLITELLKQALTLAKQFKQARQVSMSLGYLARYEEKQGNVQLALSLTDQAVTAIQRVNAKDLLLQWEWQRGRLLNMLGNEDLALAAYRRSISHIEAIRGDIPVVYKNGRSSFRETLQPVYLGLADLLIRRADASTNADAAQRLLREARNAVELIKKTELEDYFDNRCTIQSLPEVALESIAPKTAALYPILFQDRLELLISLPDGIHHQSVAVTAHAVTNSARDFADKLRNFKKDYQQTAKQLHSWLIAPISDLLTQHQIDTLIYIPDGPLRLIPLAALYDGKSYVIDHYAVVTSPGLKLFDPKPLPRENMLTLLAGLSRPGAVINTLPDEFLQLVIDATEVTQATNRSLPKSRDLSQFLSRGDADKISVVPGTPTRGRLKDPVVSDRIKDMLALPGVLTEVKLLSNLLPTTTLLDETYNRERIENEIQQAPFRVIHIASHGVFGSTSAESFIMAHDQIITIDQLESLLRSDSHKDIPIELLTLSACQTAEGDDRSPLGISGIAIKAKVRSALGSLWSVADEATVEFMQVFYQQLKQPQNSKAKAIQLAQQQLLKQKKYAHPFFWSPFILIGNWL